MPITVRLSEDTEAKLSQIAKNERKTKTDIIKESLELFFERYSTSATPYELGKDFFGKHGSGREDLSINGEQILREKFTKS